MMRATRLDAQLSQWPTVERCRSCGCEPDRSRFKRRDLCGKCFYLFECIKAVERWDRAKPETLKNIGVLRRQFGDVATLVDKISDLDFAAIKAATLDQLRVRLHGLKSREDRRRGELRVDGLAIENKLKDILNVVQLRDQYDRVAGRFSGVSTLLDRSFSPEQCRILYNLLDEVEEQSYGRVTEAHKPFEAVYLSRTRPAAQKPRSVPLAQATLEPTNGPNDLWLVDFRHRLQTAHGWRYPALVFDTHTRSIAQQALCADNGIEALMACLIEAFRARGMPRRIAIRQGQFRSRLSPLDVWLIEHDILVEPSVGDHAATLAPFEPVLRGLRAEILDQRFRTFGAAAEALALWTARANRDIGHADADEAAQNGAGVVARRYVDDVAPFDYEPHDIIRRVQERGRVSLFGRIVRVPKSFRGKDVAFRPTPQGGFLDVLFRAQKITTIKVQSVSHQTSAVDLEAEIDKGRLNFRRGDAALHHSFQALS